MLYWASPKQNILGINSSSADRGGETYTPALHPSVQ